MSTRATAGSLSKEIADAVGISAPQVTEITSKFGIGELAKTEVSAAAHATDFTTICHLKGMRPLEDWHARHLQTATLQPTLSAAP